MHYSLNRRDNSYQLVNRYRPNADSPIKALRECTVAYETGLCAAMWLVSRRRLELAAIANNCQLLHYSSQSHWATRSQTHTQATTTGRPPWSRHHWGGRRPSVNWFAFSRQWTHLAAAAAAAAMARYSIGRFLPMPGESKVYLETKAPRINCRHWRYPDSPVSATTAPFPLITPLHSSPSTASRPLSHSSTSALHAFHSAAAYHRHAKWVCA